MRLLERTLKVVEIAPRMVVEDALGGGVEGFSPDRVSVRASVIPLGGTLEEFASGVRTAKSMCLLMPLDAPVAVGDGVVSDGEMWRCVEVQKWSAHKAAKVVRG